MARIAIGRKTGARALRNIVEKLLLDIMYTPQYAPGRRDQHRCP